MREVMRSPAAWMDCKTAAPPGMFMAGRTVELPSGTRIAPSPSATGTCSLEVVIANIEPAAEMIVTVAVVGSVPVTVTAERLASAGEIFPRGVAITRDDVKKPLSLATTTIVPTERVTET